MVRHDPDVNPANWDDNNPVEALHERLTDRYADHPEAETILDRLEANLQTFWEAFSTVYGDDARSAEWAIRAVDAAVSGYESRDEELRALDRERAQQPDWFQQPDHVGYMAYVDLFAGDLDSVREKIPYLKELGVTYLHLMPLLEPRDGRSDGGYAVKDYRSVDSDLGTMGDLRTLAADLREEDILLSLDFVMNHTAREHEWAQAARAGEKRFEQFYLTFEDRTEPDQYEETVPEVFPDFAPGNFTYDEAMDRWVWTSFYDFQWDLDYANPDVFVQMLREMLFIANVGTDSLRLDAVPFLWKEMGTDCRNRPEAHEILRAYRALVRIAAPGVLFKAEAIVSPEETVKYLGTGGHEGEECEIAYGAPLMAHAWHALAREDARLLSQAMAKLPQTPESATWLNYVRCHDDIGWGLDNGDVQAALGRDPTAERRFCADFYAGDTTDSYAEGYRFQVDEATGEARTSGTMAALTGLQRAQIEGDGEDVDTAIRRGLLLHSVVYAMKGMPLLYSGIEIGQRNDFSYLADPLKADDNRWVHRPSFDWDAAEKRTEDDTVQQRLFDGIAALSDARKGLTPVHAQGDERVLEVGPAEVFAVERVYDDERMLAFANFSGEPQAVPLDGLADVWTRGGLVDILDDETVTFADRRLLVAPYGYRWVQPAPEFESGEPVSTPIAVDVETEWGTEVYLTGSLDALGNFDPDKAVPMAADEYPTWTAEIEVPEGTTFEFEWLKKRDGKVVEWSPDRYGATAGDGTVLSGLDRP
ncbi:alpha-amylase family glycosyl hydrolase [Halorhabdus sp. CUG00001]|uniref:alpha-amylase family glycosyl hydrolase n=1 Tax=Halorhabdus sp. CUG00001 TaxID=2600297 RepID=UPI00131BF5C0|nr:alpha-amylase family glycosyl hydrolase [Halorhabdus sp. CUG00001]